MYVLLFLFWIALNGKITVEIIIVGLLMSLAVYQFSRKVLGQKKANKLSLGKAINYAIILVLEIIKSAITVLKFTLNRTIQIEPQIKFFRVPLKNELSKTILANSITLTPGTITVNVDDDIFCVHGLDYTLLEGIEESIFVKLLLDMEEANG